MTNRPYYKWKASTRFVNRRGLALLLDKVWGCGNIGKPVTSTPSLLYKRGIILIWALPLLLYYIKRCYLTLFIIGSSQPPIHSHFNIARILIYSFIGIFQRFPPSFLYKHGEVPVHPRLAFRKNGPFYSFTFSYSRNKVVGRRAYPSDILKTLSI